MAIQRALQPQPSGSIPGDRAAGLHHCQSEPDPVAERLRIDNTTAALIYGVRVSQAAICDVLNLGPRVLGEKR